MKTTTVEVPPLNRIFEAGRSEENSRGFCNLVCTRT